MIQVPEYEELAEQLGIRPVRISAETPTEMYTLGSNEVADLKEFMEGPAAGRPLFAEFHYIDKSKLRISDEMFGDLPLEIIGGVQFDSHRFNKDLESMDLSAPVELRLFTLYEGRVFGVRFSDPDLERIRSISPEERVNAFAEVLILDRMYRDLKNDDERFNYVIKIARRPGNDNLKKGVMKEDGSGFSTERIRRVVALTIRKTDLSKSEKKQMVFLKE